MRRLTAAAALAWTMTARSAWGEEPASPTAARYRIEPVVDLPILAVSGVVTSSWLLGSELAPAHCAPVCPRADLNVFDRPAAGNYRPGWKTTSDVGVAVVLVFAGATTLADAGFRGGLSDFVLVGESVLIANALGVVAQMAVRRPRPLLYGEHAPFGIRSDGNAALSFFSGHSAAAFAGSVSTFWMLRARHQGAGPYVVLFSGMVMSAFVGTSRVLSGDHFPTDVFAGAIVGGAIGTLVPALHRVDVRAAPMADVQGNFVGLALRYQPPH